MLENCQKKTGFPSADGNCCGELLVSKEYNQPLLHGPAQVGYTCEDRWREPSLVVTLKGPQHA